MSAVSGPLLGMTMGSSTRPCRQQADRAYSVRTVASRAACVPGLDMTLSDRAVEREPLSHLGEPGVVGDDDQVRSTGLPGTDREGDRSDGQRSRTQAAAPGLYVRGGWVRVHACAPSSP